MALKLNERYPGRFTNPSASYPQGSFKNRTTPTAKDGSYLEKDWANDKEGFFQSLLFAAGIAADGNVDAVGASQYYNALLQAIQYQAGAAFTAAGTAPAFTLTPVPAITAYATNQRFQVLFNAAGGATPTINVSGLGAKSLKQYSSSGAKIAAVISSGQASDIFYDGTDFVLLDQLPGSTGVTQPQFNNSTNLATTAFVQGVGLQFSTIIGMSGAITLTSSAAGALCYSASATPFNVTLPLTSTMPSKTTITFFNSGGGGTMTLVCSGSDIIQTNQNVSTFQIPTGCSVTLVSNGASAWSAIGIQNSTGVTGGFKNLTGSATGLSAIASYTADELMVSNSAGFYQTLRSVSIAPSLAASGVNGLDTGTFSASTWYSEWVIWGGGPPAGLFSLSATAPIMPAGYTHKARVGWVRTDGTANKYPLSFVQSGRRVTYKVASGSNVAAMPIMVSGAQGNLTTPTWVPVSVGGFVPPTASTIYQVLNTTQGFQQMAAPNNSYGAFSSTTNPAPLLGTPGSSGAYMSIIYGMQLESTNIYVVSAGGNIFCSGWEDNL